ncbi:MAG TPA: HAMP domain-containing sensor histidine kinase [Candidatus Limnocylindrales bacterium]
MRALVPRTLRARLTLAFAAVVIIALALVLISLPRLLDEYFVQQEEKNLAARAQTMSVLIQVQLRDSLELGSDDPKAVVAPSDPLRASAWTLVALGRPDDEDGTLHRLTELVAQSDVVLTLSEAPTQPLPTIETWDVPLTTAASQPGQARDAIIGTTTTFLVRDPAWSQFEGRVPERLFTLRLSQPYTYRLQTIGNLVGVLIVAASAALLVAVVVSAIFADRLTVPIRRLTRASRALGEGDFTARVEERDDGAPEVTELAHAFNRMAERLEESVTFIRRDRDRSRDFLADVSHELRTPIAALRTFNELLREGAVDEPATRDEFLASSQQQIDRLDWLSTNLLELSKLDSGLVALELRPDDLRAVIESARSQAEPAAKRKGVALVAELPPAPVRQRHDPRRIGQVLTNLISNALRFTPRGGTVTVSLASTADGAEIVVADTGVGISADELPYVFDRFYRGTRANEERGAGSGLGLSIVRSIVEMHGGSVSIESVLGAGTRVAVSLPRDMTVSSPAGVQD